LSLSIVLPITITFDFLELNFRSPYSNISNKVLFGDFESDWFDQEFVLSPILFFVLMNDLVSMLSEHNLGVNLASDIINCLLFADDIILMDKSPQDTSIDICFFYLIISKIPSFEFINCLAYYHYL
jgi:hypothetical protein